MSLTPAEKRRLEVARALATEPRLLLLDEMLTGLTPVEAQSGVQLIRDVRARGITVMMVEHVMEVLLPLVDRAVVLDLGRVLTIGAPHGRGAQSRRDPRLSRRSLCCGLRTSPPSYRGLRALQGVSLEVATRRDRRGGRRQRRGQEHAAEVDRRPGRDGRHDRVRRPVAAARCRAHRITRLGVSMVPEGRRLFPRLSVEDNLRLGAYAKRGADRFKPLELVFSLFPRLQERLAQRAETLSGGEQQMLAIGRALMTQPRFLMLDEPSQGIMPRLVDDILAAVTRIRELGVTVLLVEQRLVEALAIADRAYVLQTGRIVLSGPAAEIAADDAVRRAYLGI